MPAAAMLSFDIEIPLNPTFVFRSSTIWPMVNDLSAKIDALDAAEDTLIAELQALKGKTP